MCPIAAKRAHLPLTKNKLLRPKANKVERRAAKHQATHSASEVAFVPVAAVHLCVAFGLKCARTSKGARGTMASDLEDRVLEDRVVEVKQNVVTKAVGEAVEKAFRKGYDMGRDYGKGEIEELREQLQSAKELVELFETRSERFRGYLAEIEAVAGWRLRPRDFEPDAGRRVRPRTDPHTDPLA